MTKANKKIGEDGLPVKRNRRSRKDPRAPKRSKSAYIFFAIESRESIKAEIGGDARVGDIAKLTSQRWKSLSDVERSHWENVSKADRDRYQEEKAAYTGPLLIPPAAESKLSERKQFKKKPQEKDPDAPKRPLTAFLYFSQQMRPTLKERNPGWRMADLSQELGRMWRGMSEAARMPYAAHEEEVREKWRADSAKYKEEKSNSNRVAANNKALQDAEEEAEKFTQLQQKKLLKKQEKQQQRELALQQEIQQRDHQRTLQQHQVDQQHAYDLYRQQASVGQRDDGGYMGMSAQYAPNSSSAYPGMLSHHQQQDIHGMMSMGVGYPSGSSAAAYQQAQQHAAFYGDHAAGRYAASTVAGLGGMPMGQEMDRQGYASAAMAGMGGLGGMGGDMSGMGIYGYGGSGMMMDPSTGYGYMGGM